MTKCINEEKNIFYFMLSYIWRSNCVRYIYIYQSLKIKLQKIKSILIKLFFFISPIANLKYKLIVWINYRKIQKKTLDWKFWILLILFDLKLKNSIQVIYFDIWKMCTPSQLIKNFACRDFTTITYAVKSHTRSLGG